MKSNMKEEEFLQIPSFDDVLAAHERIKPHIHNKTS